MSAFATLDTDQTALGFAQLGEVVTVNRAGVAAATTDGLFDPLPEEIDGGKARENRMQFSVASQFGPLRRGDSVFRPRNSKHYTVEHTFFDDGYVLKAVVNG